jgi:16S rRNA (guanine527-N7)-methyltransferase
VSVPELGPLSERFSLPIQAQVSLETLAHLLAEDPLAPTTVREPSRVRDDHLADSLVALDLPLIRAAGRIVDIGAGAGLPGLALAAALPETQMTLVEGNGRKCEFITRAAESMGLSNVVVAHARAEEFEVSTVSFDVVTARALAPLDVVAEYAAPLLRVGGHLVAWRGKREPQVEAEASCAAEILGLCVQDPVRVRPYPAAEHRYLHLMSKVSATPARFPRRPGMARKRPLGGR